MIKVYYIFMKITKQNSLKTVKKKRRGEERGVKKK
jgi:hypothetical protein